MDRYPRWVRARAKEKGVKRNGWYEIGGAGQYRREKRDLGGVRGMERRGGKRGEGGGGVRSQMGE